MPELTKTAGIPMAQAVAAGTCHTAVPLAGGPGIMQIVATA